MVSTVLTEMVVADFEEQVEKLRKQAEALRTNLRLLEEDYGLPVGSACDGSLGFELRFNDKKSAASPKSAAKLKTKKLTRARQAGILSVRVLAEQSIPSIRRLAKSGSFKMTDVLSQMQKDGIARSEINTKRLSLALSLYLAGLAISKLGGSPNGGGVNLFTMTGDLRVREMKEVNAIIKERVAAQEGKGNYGTKRFTMPELSDMVIAAISATNGQGLRKSDLRSRLRQMGADRAAMHVSIYRAIKLLKLDGRINEASDGTLKLVD